MLDPTHLMKKVLKLCNLNIKLWEICCFSFHYFFHFSHFFITFISPLPFSKSHRFTVNVYYIFVVLLFGNLESEGKEQNRDKKEWMWSQRRMREWKQSSISVRFRLMKHHLRNKNITTLYDANQQPTSEREKGYKDKQKQKQRSYRTRSVLVYPSSICSVHFIPGIDRKKPWMWDRT